MHKYKLSEDSIIIVVMRWIGYSNRSNGEDWRYKMNLRRLFHERRKEDWKSSYPEADTVIRLG